MPGPPILYAPAKLSLLNIRPFALLVFNVPREISKVKIDPLPISIDSASLISPNFNGEFSSNIAFTVELSVASVSTSAM